MKSMLNVKEHRIVQMVSDKFKPQNNDTILSWQCSKLPGEQDEHAEEWIGHLRLKWHECSQKEKED